MQKLLTFFSKNISMQAIFDDKSFNDTLTNNIVSFEQLSPDEFGLCAEQLKAADEAILQVFRDICE